MSSSLGPVDPSPIYLEEMSVHALCSFFHFNCSDSLFPDALLVSYLPVVHAPQICLLDFEDVSHKMHVPFLHPDLSLISSFCP